MPTVDQPLYFDTGVLVSSRYDRFFKWLSLDCSDQTGDVEAPCGFVSLMWVEAPYEIEEYILQDTYRDDSEEYLRAGVKTGWYVTLQDNNGLIWAFSFGDSTLAEENARREFAGSEEYYARWSEDVDI